MLKHKYGMAFKEQVRLGQVWQPWYAALLQQAGLRAESIQRRQHLGPRKEVRLVRVSPQRALCRHTGGSMLCSPAGRLLVGTPSSVLSKTRDCNAGHCQTRSVPGILKSRQELCFLKYQPLCFATKVTSNPRGCL